MKCFSVTAISPALRKLGSFLFVFLLLCGAGQQAAELANLNCGQVSACDQTEINQASVFTSSSYLAMPRTAEQIKGFRHSGSFQPLFALLPNPAAPSLSVPFLSLRNGTDIPLQPVRYYGMLPLPNAPPAHS